MTLSKLLFCLVALVCYSCVQGGTLTVGFAEDDFSIREDVGNLGFTLSVRGTQDNGDVVFGVEALTSSQYLARASDNPDLCNPEFSQQFQDVSTDRDPAELEDLSVNNVNCARALDQPPNSDIICSFPISNDTIYEGDEFIVMVLRVINNATNIILLERKCAIGHVLINRNQGTSGQFVLELLTPQDLPHDPIIVTEGQENFFLTIRKNFLTELPIEIDFLITSDLSGTAYNSPSITDGVDYSFNGGDRSTMIQVNETHINLPVYIIDDDVIETGERFGIRMTASFIDARGVRTNLPISPIKAQILILDNDVVTVGFDSTIGLSFNLLEGETLNLCAVVLSHVWYELTRDIEVDVFTEDGTAKIGTHFTTTPPGLFETTLGLNEHVCVGIQAIDDSILERSRTLTVKIQDAGLAQLTDPDEREIHERLNVVDPCCVTVTIDDNDGTPLQPNITKISVVNKDELSFEWAVDEEGELRPVDCFYGNITVTAIRDTDKPERGGSPTEETIRETIIPFDLCPSGKDTTHTLPGIEDNNKQYTIVICARNRFGDNCSKPIVYIDSPPPTQQVTTVPPGLIAGVMVAVIVVVLCCCLIFILCLLLFLCGDERERRYFPQKRERQLAKEFGHRHLPQNSVSSFSDDEFEETKVPL